MRCLIVVPSLGRAGAETQAVEMANGLAAMGHEIHFCSFEHNLAQRSRLTSAVQYHHVLRRSKYDWSLVSRLASIIDREQIEIAQGVLQSATLVAVLAAKRSTRKPPVVAAVHTTIHRSIKQEIQARVLYRRILSRLPAVVFVCEHQRAHWLGKYPELAPVARVVHNGVDPSRFQREQHAVAALRLREELGIPGDAYIFTCVAAFRPEKGHKLLVDAFSEMPANVYLVLAGDGERRQAVEAAVDLAKLTERVRVLGNVSDIRPVIVASNATVLASTAVETFSMAMLESMALGVPMIAPQIGGLAEAITSGETGMLFPIGDTKELGRCMSVLATDVNRTRAMGEAAQLRVSKLFTRRMMLEKSERVLLDVLNQSRENMTNR